MELFWYDIRTMSQAEYDSAVAGMTSERRQQLSDAATDDDRRRMAGCELLVRQHLGADAAITFDAIGRITTGREGRYISTAASGAWAVCAVGDRPMETVVEVIRGAQEKFIARSLTEAEAHYVRYGDDGCFARFWECWTAKEALFKLTGQGPLLALSAFDLPSDVALDHVKDHGCTVVTAMRLG